MGNANRGYRIVPFAGIREAVIAVMAPAQQRHTIHLLFEADVTDVRARLRVQKAETGEALSLTALIIRCTADAALGNKDLTAARVSARKLAHFDDVHVATTIEARVDGHDLPLTDLVRCANRRSVREISDQLRSFSADREKERVGAMRRFSMLPGFLRTRIMTAVFGKPKTLMEEVGTALVTSVGMFGAGGGHAIPFQAFTLCVAVGGITRKPGVVGERVEPREFLSLTASFDHDIVDGAPAARFAQELRERIEGGQALLDPDDA